MKLNDKWEIVSGPQNHDFTLREWYEGKRRDGGVVLKHRDSYFPSVEQCVSKLMKQETIDSVDNLETIEEMMTFLTEIEQSILKGVGK